MSTTLRQASLRVLRAAGVRSFLATSGLGHRFVCYPGDFLGENPYYNRAAFRVELEMCAAWLRNEEKPLVFDVGANVGFWSTHLSQMLAVRSPDIYAFEPVPATLLKLVNSVERLDLEAHVHVVAAAVLDVPRPACLTYSPHETLFAQVGHGEINTRIGDRLAYAASLTLDGFSEELGIVPTFIKIDVEGSEISVLRGARRLLERADRPCLMFEFNPTTLSETSADCSAFRELLAGYHLYYVDDFEGQRRPLGESVGSTEEISWVCNLFAVPSTPHCAARWVSALAAARGRLETRPS